MKPARARLLVLLGGLFFFSAWLEVEAEERSPVRTSAMTFNIRLGVAKDGANHWDQRRPLVYEVIRSRQPDFCGLQEAWKFQLDAILENVPGYAFVGRSRQEDPAKGEWCPLLYRTDSWTLVDSGTFWLSDTPEEVASTSWGNVIPRICTWARLRSKAQDDFQIDVYNVHFDHKSQSSRERRADLITRRIAANSAARPFLILGDFNAAEDNPAMVHFRENPVVPLRDTYRLLHPDQADSGTFNHWNGTRDGAKIDGVFAPLHMTRVVRAEIIHDHTGEGDQARYPSDHYPVDALIDWLPWSDAEAQLQAQNRSRIAEMSQILEDDPQSSRAWQERGIYRFFNADITGSIADFDEYLKLNPSQEPFHWQRGLSHYLAGQFVNGSRQFETHHKVNPDDVENSAWHLACTVRAEEKTLAEASSGIIPTRGDSRVPMMEIHRLYAGQGSTEEVLAACGEKRNALCFAHLYLGLWFEVQGDMKKARAHMMKSAIDYRMDHYMSQVAVVHARVRGWYFPER